MSHKIENIAILIKAMQNMCKEGYRRYIQKGHYEV